VNINGKCLDVKNLNFDNDHDDNLHPPNPPPPGPPVPGPGPACQNGLYYDGVQSKCLPCTQGCDSCINPT
jgi:hypothetical protein